MPAALSVILFAVVFFGLMGFWAWSAWRIVRYVRLGRPDPERLQNLGWRLRETLLDVFLQRPLIREGDGWWHVVIFYGFLAVTVGTVEMIIEGFWHGFSFHFAGPVYSVILLAQDLLACGIIAAIGASHVRRFIIRPVRLRNTWKHKMDALVCLWIIVVMMVTLLLERGAEFCAHGRGMAYALPPDRLAVISGAVASVLARLSLSDGALAAIWNGSWWVHMVALLSFVAYLPYSKHFHVFSAIPNIFFRSKHPLGRSRPVDGLLQAIESESLEMPKVGTNRVEDLRWKDLLDLYTCMECGRCQAACPAYNTGKMLNPRQLIWDIRGHVNRYGNALLGAAAEGKLDAIEREPIAGGAVKEQVLWACTTCAGCIYECPVGIEHVQKIIDLRRHLAMMEGKMPTEVQGFFEKVESAQNPYGLPASDRAAWTKKASVPVPTLADKRHAEWLWWVGCAGSYDERNQRVSLALAKILHAAGVDFAILGEEERCNGETARRLGNELLGQMMARQNVETLNGYGVKKIITACPHCFNTLKNEYPDFGGRFEVKHSSEMISDLVRTGRLKLTEEVKTSVVFHDSCYLGRYNHVFDEPRAGLGAVPGLTLVEADRKREKGFCCGGGGGRVWMEEHEGKRVNHERVEELLAKGTAKIGVACPFCITMMEDGVKAKKKENEVQVMDVAELVAQAVKEAAEVKAKA